MSSFERIITLIAAFFTIFQVLISLFLSVPKIEISIGGVASEMILPTRIVIYVILGCISAVSYGALVAGAIYHLNIAMGLFVSGILSTLGAWFALLLVKILFAVRQIENVSNMSHAAVEFLPGPQLLIILYALLFGFGLWAFGIPIMSDNDNGEEANPTPFLFTTILPFILFSFF